MINSNSGCLKCKERMIGCHKNCEKYKRYLEILSKIKENKKLDRDVRSLNRTKGEKIYGY